MSRYDTYLHSHPREGEIGYSEADWETWRRMYSESGGITNDFGIYSVSDGQVRSYSKDVRNNQPNNSHWK